MRLTTLNYWLQAHGGKAGVVDLLNRLNGDENTPPMRQEDVARIYGYRPDHFSRIISDFTVKIRILHPDAFAFLDSLSERVEADYGKQKEIANLYIIRSPGKEAEEKMGG